MNPRFGQLTSRMLLFNYIEGKEEWKRWVALQGPVLYYVADSFTSNVGHRHRLDQAEDEERVQI